MCPSQNDRINDQGRNELADPLADLAYQDGKLTRQQLSQVFAAPSILVVAHRHVELQGALKRIILQRAKPRNALPLEGDIDQLFHSIAMNEDDRLPVTSCRSSRDFRRLIELTCERQIPNTLFLSSRLLADGGSSLGPYEHFKGQFPAGTARILITGGGHVPLEEYVHTGTVHSVITLPQDTEDIVRSVAQGFLKARFSESALELPR